MDANADEVQSKIRLARWNWIFDSANAAFEHEAAYDRRFVFNYDELWRNKT